jgi:hypothetical protein
VSMYFIQLWHTGIRWKQCVDVLCVIVTHMYKMKAMCRCTLCHLSSYACVSQWHKVHWHIVIILYMCVTMTQSTLTHCYHLIPMCVCSNDTKYIDTLLSSYFCVSQSHVLCVNVTHMYKMIIMCQCIFWHCVAQV